MSRLLPIVVLSLSALLAACDGSDGADGAAGPAGSNGAPGTNGGDGLNSLTTLTAEPAGLICTSGGQRIDTGLDDDGDGVLDTAEIEQTSYVCSNNVATLYATETRGDLCLHGATLLKSGLDTNDNDILDAGEVLTTATICQNNAAPTFRLREHLYFGLPPTYDAANRRYSFVRYARPGGDLYLYSDDGNDDPVTITYGAHADIDFSDFEPSSTFTDLDDPAHYAEAGLRVMMFDTLAPGVYDLPVQVSDGEANITYTLRVDARDPGWTFTPLLAQEGVDDYAEGTVTMAVPTLMDMMVDAGVPGIEVCVDGQPCLPTLTAIEFCEDGYPPGDPVGCFVYYDTNPVSIPAGTTSFTVRRAITDDTSWGTGTGLAMSMRLAAENSFFTLDWLDDFFTVVDNDAAPTVTFIDTLLTIPSGQLDGLLFQSSLADVWIPFTFSGTAVSGIDYTTTAHVLVDGTGAGTLNINTLLDEAMSGDLLLNIAFDTVYGLITGAEPSATVTITPPPELALSFAGASSSVSRYESFYCVDVALNRPSYIVAVDFTVEFAGTAVVPADYAFASGDGAVTLDPGAIIHSICLAGTVEELATDRTVEISISNISNAVAGTYPTHTLTLTGAAFPVLDFDAASSAAMMDISVDSDCVAVMRAGAVPAGIQQTAFTVRATPSDPALAPMLEGAGFIEADGQFERYDYFVGDEQASIELCFWRQMETEIAVGDYSVLLEIVGVENGHVGDTYPTISLQYRQDYGVRSIYPQMESGSEFPFATVVAANGAVARVGDIEGALVGELSDGSVDATLVYRDGNGVRWQRQLGPEGDSVPRQVILDEDGDVFLVIDHYISYGVGVPYGSTLYRINSSGTTVWSQTVPVTAGLLAAQGNVLLVSDGGTVQALAANGATLWTHGFADFGLTGCTGASYAARAIAATGNWHIVARGSPDGCAIDDLDSDTVVHDHVIAGVTAAGTFGWRYDDAAEAGASALSGVALNTQTDAAGNLYLGDTTGQLLKVTAAGVLSWAVSTPVPGGGWSEAAGFNVSPGGTAASAWNFQAGMFGALPPNDINSIDIGISAYSSSGTQLQATVLGALFSDRAYWVLANDDGSLFMRAGLEQVDGFFAVDSAGIATQLPLVAPLAAWPQRMDDGNIMLIDTDTSTARRYDALFDPL